MKTEEKVMAQWPLHLRDTSQQLETLPEGVDTDYLIVRFQGNKNRAYLATVADSLQALQLSQDGDLRVSFTTVHQRPNRWQPLNSWSVIRGAFDWLMSYGRSVADTDTAAVRNKQAQRDERRRERASR